MMHGQMIRELKMMRISVGTVVAVAPDDAAQLFQAGANSIQEMRSTLAFWRAREGIEMPEYTKTDEEREGERLVQAERDIAEMRQEHDRQRRQKEVEQER